MTDAAIHFPKLRSDIEVGPAEADAGGRTAIIVIDPLSQSYVRLPWPESELFRALREDRLDPEGAIRRRLGALPDKEDLASFLDLLKANNLLIASEPAQWHAFSDHARSRRTSWLSQLLSQYLFFRVPLLRPAEWLKGVVVGLQRLPWRALAAVQVVVMVLGAYLISHQLDAFVATFQRAAEIEQLLLFAVALLLLKAIHEFGHAVVAARFGCDVPVIGVAFMMGAPLLYTDTTDTWRLTQREKRLAVVFAGVSAEMIVAGWMALLWPFLPPGVWRDLAFALMTASIATSVIVNLNPLMRFDGYFALSDWLRMPNLQARAFAFGRWRMRELLFALGRPAPEEASPARIRLLVCYAWLVWIYRLVIAAAIAWAIYALTFKLLGMALFIVEIAVLLILPAIREIKMWWTLRQEIAANSRVIATSFAAFCCCALVAVPWWSRVEIPAIVGYSSEIPVHATNPARVVTVAVDNGRAIAKGDLIAELEAPHLNLQLDQIRHQTAALTQRKMGAASVAQDRDQIVVIDAELDRLASRQAAVERQAKELVLLARSSGTVVDLDHKIRPGVWVRPDIVFARIVSGDRRRVRGLVQAVDLPRIAIGAHGWFVPDDPVLPRLAVVLKEVSPVAERLVQELALADQHGGSITTGLERNELVPTVSVYGVTLEAMQGIGLRGGEDASPMMRGVVQLNGAPQSILGLVVRRIAQVMVREQAF